MKINRKKAQDAFSQYVSNYNQNDPKIRLKIEHTGKVSVLCEAIAENIGLTQEETDIAWLIGLLHDIGRFEQLRQYGTFFDAKSVDHACFGAKLLFDQGMIRAYIENDREDTLIKTAIRMHSCYRLPEGMEQRTEMFCNIIRDADKIDIMRVNTQTPMEDIYDVTTEDLKNSVISPQVMQSFFEEHATLRSLKKTPADYIAGHISLVYELVYPISIQLMWEQGFLQKLLAFESSNCQTQEQLCIIREHVKEFAEKRLMRQRMK